MKVYILFEDTEEYDSQSTVTDVFTSEKGAISAMETAILNRASTSSWTYRQVNETKWVRDGHEGDGFHVEPWDVIGCAGCPAGCHECRPDFRHGV